MLSTVLLVIIALLALAGPVAAATVTINPGDSIATAITSAGSGGTVILNPGTYNQHDIIVANDVRVQANTSYGHGPVDTVIDAQIIGRIFDDSGNHALTIDNLTLQNGYVTSGGWSQGGAIYTSSGSISVISSTITGCSASSDGAISQGGAIYTSSGSISVTSSTFIGCSVFSSNDGLSYGGALYSNSGSITVTSSTFSGCSAFESGNDGFSNGGAIFSDSSLAVTSSTFSGCSAVSRGLGGAIFRHPTSSGTGTVRFSRLVNDDAGTAIFGPITAADNWWGSNGNPSGHLTNGATAATWLVLGATASPASIATTGTSAIRANLTFRNDGTDTSGGGIFAPDWMPVAFTAAGGTVSPVHAATDYGIATTTFTPSGTGTATIMATVDQQSVSVPVTVTTPVTSTNITTIAVDPGTATTVYAGVDNKGIYNTTDGGTLWLPATTQPANKHIRALVISPASSSTLYAGTYGGGVNRSINSGADWLPCTNTGLANLNVLSLVSDRNGKLYAGTEGGVYTSADNCASWTAVNGGLP